MALDVGELLGTIGLDDAPFESGLSGALGKMKAFGGKLIKAATVVGAAGAVALSSALVGAMSTEAANDKLAAQLGANSELSGRLGKVAGDLYSHAYGESLGQVNEAIRLTGQELADFGDFSDAELQGVTASVLDLATAFDEDLGAVTRAAGQLLKTGLAKDANQALDLITVGMQNGSNRAEDLLDTLNEYPTQFRKVGLSGADALGLIQQGLLAGARDADIVADAVKEFSIRMSDGSAADALKTIGLNAKTMLAQFAKGGPAARTAMDTVLDKLRAMPPGAKKAGAAFGLFGTQSEDLGAALDAMDLTSAAKGMGQIDGAAKRMGDTLNDNATANITAFTRQVKTAFIDTIGGRVLPAANDAAKFLATEFGPAFAAAGVFITEDLIPAAQDAKRWFGDEVMPVLQTIADVIEERVSPTIDALGDVITQDIVPAAQGLADTVRDASPPFITLGQAIAPIIIGAAALGVIIASKVTPVVIRLGGPAIGALIAALGGLLIGISAALGFIEDHYLIFGTVAALITAVFIPIMIAAGVQATISAALIVAGWVAQAAAAVSSGATTVAIWVLLKASAISAAVVHSAQIVIMVAKWVWLGVQSLAAAARVALAWIIAMGPIAWATAAVIGIAILIIKNWDRIKSATSTAWSAIAGFVSSKVQAIVGFITGIPGAVLGLAGKLQNAGKTAMSGLFKGFTDALGNAAGFIGDVGRLIVNKIIDILNKPITALKSALNFDIPIPAAPDVHIRLGDKIPTIPHLARGGPFDAGLAMVGEKGPELAMLPGRGHMFTARETADLLRGRGPSGGPRTVVHLTQNIHPGPGMDEEQLAGKAARKAAEALSGAVR